MYHYGNYFKDYKININIFKAKLRLLKIETIILFFFSVNVSYGAHISFSSFSCSLRLYNYARCGAQPLFFYRAEQAHTAVISRGYYRCERCLRLITAECKRLIVTRCLYLELNALCFHHINRWERLLLRNYSSRIKITDKREAVQSLANSIFLFLQTHISKEIYYQINKSYCIPRIHKK